MLVIVGEPEDERIAYLADGARSWSTQRVKEDHRGRRFATIKGKRVAVEAGLKAFEIRQDDRGYNPGDVLTLREYDPIEQAYTGRTLCRHVTHTTTFAQRAGYVVMALAERGDS